MLRDQAFNSTDRTPLGECLPAVVTTLTLFPCFVTVDLSVYSFKKRVIAKNCKLFSILQFKKSDLLKHV